MGKNSKVIEDSPLVFPFKIEVHTSQNTIFSVIEKNSPITNTYFFESFDEKASNKESVIIYIYQCNSSNSKVILGWIGHMNISADILRNAFITIQIKQDGSLHVCSEIKNAGSRLTFTMFNYLNIAPHLLDIVREPFKPSFENLILDFPFSIRLGESNDVLVTKNTPIRNTCFRRLAMNHDIKEQTISFYGGEDKVASNNPPIGIITLHDLSSTNDINEEIWVDTMGDDRGYFHMFSRTKRKESYVFIYSRFLEY